MSRNDKIGLATTLAVTFAMVAFLIAGIVLQAVADVPEAAMRGALAAMVTGGLHMTAKVAIMLVDVFRPRSNA